jgi:hypothetical protein
MTGRQVAYSASTILIILLLFVTMLMLATVGRRGRVHPAGDGLRISIISSPEEAYRRWHASGERGRVVVSVSRWLNFVDIDDGALIPKGNPVPLRVTNLAAGLEKLLSPENFLCLAVKTGIAREIIHLVPDEEYPARLASVREVEGAMLKGDAIMAPYIGTPRRITTLRRFKRGGEPVLLYLNASYFRYSTPEDVLAQLRKSSVSIDAAVLCLSDRDPAVSPEERDRLRRFALLLEGAIK